MSTASGRLGELCIENWLTGLGWTCCQRNLRVPGGEIDRIFIRERISEEQCLDVCIAEIKTTHVQSVRRFSELFGEAKIRSLVRPHQMRNLWRCAAYYESCLRARKKKSMIRIYVRYFLVVQAPPRLVKALKASVRVQKTHLPMRLCRAGEKELILAWMPDAPAQSL